MVNFILLNLYTYVFLLFVLSMLWIQVYFFCLCCHVVDIKHMHVLYLEFLEQGFVFIDEQWINVMVVIICSFILDFGILKTR